MRLTSPIEWGFDPDKSDIPALTFPTGRKVWAALRRGNIVDQYFNAQCYELALLIEADPPATPIELSRMAAHCELYFHGNHPGARGADYEWWRDLFHWLRGEVQIEHKVPNEE